MTKEKKIKAIYENIADKTLSFGCYIWSISYCDIDYWFYKYKYYENLNWISNTDYIVWHPVMIWDVLDFYSKKLWTFQLYNNTTMDLLEVWKEKRKPLEMQNDDCIDYVFNLLPNK